MLVAGVDSSTQSVKVVLVPRRGRRRRRRGILRRIPTAEADPQDWWRRAATSGRRAARSSGGDRCRRPAARDGGARRRRPRGAAGAALERPALGAAGAKVVDRLGGPTACADAIGTVPTASFTVTKLRWMAEHEPDRAARTSVGAAAPRLADLAARRRAPATASRRPTTATRRAPATSHPPAAGGGPIAAWALDRTDPPRLPRLVGPGDVAGTTPSGQVLSAGTGDNMAAALGLGLADGDVVVSIGTSGTAYSRRRGSCGRSDGLGGRLLRCDRPLPAAGRAPSTRSRILSVTAGLLGVDLDELARLALAARPGAGGLTLLPYLDGERTPNRPQASGVVQRPHVRGDPRRPRPGGRRGAAVLARRRHRPRARRHSPPGAPDRRRGPQRRRAPSRPRSRAPPSRPHPPPSTWRSAPPARQHGRWPPAPARRRGRSRSRTATRASRRRGSARGTRRCGTRPERGGARRRKEAPPRPLAGRGGASRPA